MALIRSCPHALIISLASFKLFIVHQVGSVTIRAVYTRADLCYGDSRLVAVGANMLVATVKVTVNMPGLF